MEMKDRYVTTRAHDNDSHALATAPWTNVLSLWKRRVKLSPFICPESLYSSFGRSFGNRSCRECRDCHRRQWDGFCWIEVGVLRKVSGFPSPPVHKWRNKALGRREVYGADRRKRRRRGRRWGVNLKPCRIEIPYRPIPHIAIQVRIPRLEPDRIPADEPAQLQMVAPIPFQPSGAGAAGR
jgi:hypothetical protein